MELDYFSLYLRRYLRDHSFSNEEIDSAIVGDNAATALQTYVDQRNAGNTDCGATEVALQDLFLRVGLSREEASSDILEEYFFDRIQMKEPLVFNFWTQQLKNDDSIWEPYHIDGELGLNEELVKEGKRELLNRIDQFLTNHGV